MMTTYQCKWCGRDCTVPVPDDEIGQKATIAWAKNAACDPCSDYQKMQHRRYAVIQKLMLLPNAKRNDDCMSRVRKMFGAVVSEAEKFYGASFQRFFEQDFAAITEKPELAEFACKQFEQGIRQMIKANEPSLGISGMP